MCECDGVVSNLSSKMRVIIKSSASSLHFILFYFYFSLLLLPSDMKSGKLIVKRSRKRRMRRVGRGSGVCVGGYFLQRVIATSEEGEEKGGSRGRSAHTGGGSEIISTRRSILPQLEQKLFASVCLLKSVGSDASLGSLGAAFV